MKVRGSERRGDLERDDEAVIQPTEPDAFAPSAT